MKDEVESLREHAAATLVALKEEKKRFRRVSVLLGLVTRDLRIARDRHFREPDSDAYELCVSCGRNPYNVPPHKDDCFVVRIASDLRMVDRAMKDMKNKRQLMKAAKEKR